MKIGYIGLGKMGFNMVERLLEKKHEVLVFDKNEEAVKRISSKGAMPASSLESLISAMALPRLVWLMVPHQAVDTVLQGLTPLLQKGDTVIDGGNSPYKNGACIMVGGRKEIFRKYKNLFRDLACKGGYAYMGGPGSGHFVKMVHNGIEYGMMQALAEGFALMKASPFEFDLTQIAKLYNHKSVVESRLVGWLHNAFAQHGENLDDISGSVSQSGEGSWTVEAAQELGVPVPVIEGSLNFRIQSQAHPSYTGKILSAVRNQFGGHEVFRKPLGE
jgi:6-phosphogluconate dehydrogenase